MTAPVAVSVTRSGVRSRGRASRLSSPPVTSERASPKSVTRTRPSAPTSTLSGLKSRCNRPTAWAAARPRPGVDEHRHDVAPRSLPARQPVGQRVALDELHRDVDVAVGGGADVVDRDDVGVAELRDRLRLAHQPRPGLALAEPHAGAQQLERDPPIELRIVRREHHAHAAGADPPQDHVAADRVAHRHHRIDRAAAARCRAARPSTPAPDRARRACPAPAAPASPDRYPDRPAPAPAPPPASDNPDTSPGAPPPSPSPPPASTPTRTPPPRCRRGTAPLEGSSPGDRIYPFNDSRSLVNFGAPRRFARATIRRGEPKFLNNRNKLEGVDPVPVRNRLTRAEGEGS
jgi:hypothetical protein